MNRAKVTVIISCFNSERYLTQTLQSVLTQTYEDFRVIAVDDGSTDHTAAILKDYSGKIRIFSHQDHGNHGQAAAFNLGLSFADSEYIAFMDHDDIWHPDKLKKQAKILDQYKEVGLVYTNGHVIDGNGKVLYPLFNNDHEETNKIGSILLDCYIRTPSLVMVRNILLQAAGPFTVGIIPDQDMWVRIHERAKFYYVNEMLTNYRVHSGQLSQTTTTKMWEDASSVLNKAMKRYPYPADIRRKRRAVIHYRLGQCAIGGKQYFAAVYHFLMAFINDPFRAIGNMKRVLR